MSARNNALSQERKQQIAKEFNYSETAFLHDAEPGHSRRLDIFTRNEELNFGGQAAIGTAHYIFQKLENDEHRVATQKGPWTSTLLTKAGRIPIYFDPVRHVAAAEVPHMSICIARKSRGTTSLPLSQTSDSIPRLTR